METQSTYVPTAFDVFGGVDVPLDVFGGVDVPLMAFGLCDGGREQCLHSSHLSS